MQPDNETWSINRKEQEKHFFLQNEAGRLVSDFFSLFKNGQYEVKASSLQLSFDILR